MEPGFGRSAAAGGFAVQGGPQDWARPWADWTRTRYEAKALAAGRPPSYLEFRRVGGLAHWSPSSLPEGMDPGIREVAYWNAPELTPTTANDEINTSLAYGFAFDDVQAQESLVHSGDPREAGITLNPF